MLACAAATSHASRFRISAAPTTGSAPLAKPQRLRYSEGVKGWRGVGTVALALWVVGAIVMPGDALAFRLDQNAGSTAAVSGDALSAVTCVSASDCWAVGSHDPAQHRTLIEHYDGAGWKVASSQGNERRHQ
jgi:hypothetical protein